MRLSTLIPVIFAAAAPAAAERGALGLALGNQKGPSTSDCKTTQDYEQDFEAIKGLTKLVRTYSAGNCQTAQNIIPAAKNKGFKVVMGVWPDTEESFNQDFNALKQYVPGNEETIEAITVGSETLYRGNLNAEQLYGKIKQVQDQFPKIQIGTVDSWNKFADGTANFILQKGVDYILANGFAYWQGQEIGNATNTFFDDMSQAKAHIEQAAGENSKKIRFGTGETGWPTTGGSNYGPAEASTKNAEEYWKKAVCGMLAWGGDVFYFEAFDEAWKPKSTGDNGQPMDEKHWGLFTADRKPKFDTSCPKN